MNRYKLGHYNASYGRIYALYQLSQDGFVFSYRSIYESKNYIDTLHIYNLRIKEAA